MEFVQLICELGDLCEECKYLGSYSRGRLMHALRPCLGEKLGHSYSPQLHAQLASYPYDLYEVAPERLDAFLRTTELAGMNVTIPYKKAVMPVLQGLVSGSGAHRQRQYPGAPRRRHVYGDNTDLRRLLLYGRGDFAIAGKKALVLGNGGVSLTVQRGPAGPGGAGGRRHLPPGAG